MRIACLLVPDLPLHAELRASPDLRDLPLAITSGPGARAEILALSREAAQHGVRTGQTLTQARSVCPEIEARIASPILERTAREALLDIALSLAPRAELADRSSGIFAAEGAVYIDASGIEALHGNISGDSERAFASMLHARAERAGIAGLVALASSRGVARLAARHLSLSLSDGLINNASSADPATTLVLPPDREIDFLSPLPIDLLDPDDATAQTLTRFGIHRIHDLLRLSRRDLAARLGPGLLELVARARGEEIEPPLPEPRSTTIEEGEDLEVAIGSLEPLAFVLRGLVARLVERLKLRALGCTRLRLALQLENGAKRSLQIGVASPCQDERVLLRLLRLAAENDPPPAPIEGIVLLCDGVPLRREQLDLFLPRGPSPSALDQTLAELRSICGSDRVGSPEIIDDHRPDAFGLKPFQKRKAPPRKGAPPTSPTGTQPSAHRAPTARNGPRLTMRAVRPPLRAEVRLAGGRPAHLRSAVSQGEVLHAAGPWRTTGHWWSESAHFAVDHYDIQVSDGTILRLCFNWKTKRWQVDGLYD
jgi:protein ImuB